MTEQLQACTVLGPGAVLDYDESSPNAASLRWVAPHTLWGVNRLDLAVKVFYALDHLQCGTDLPVRVDAKNLYRRHIELRTGGREPGNLLKQNIDAYERDFRRLIDSLAGGGFQARGAIPLSEQGLILNGAHRLASSLALGLTDVACFAVPQAPSYDWDMGWFLWHGFSAQEIAVLLHVWVSTNPLKARVLVLESDDEQVCALATRMIYAGQPVLAWRKLNGASIQGEHRTGRVIYLEAESGLQEHLARLRLKHPALECWYLDGLPARQLSLELLPSIANA
ncbi:hypothetical protein [Pseudomonas rustica]